MALIDDIKTALRVKDDSVNAEVQTDIDACKKLLSVAGVGVIDEADPLTKKAIILYCKANFGIDNAESDKYMQHFKNLVSTLKIASEYHAVE